MTMVDVAKPGNLSGWDSLAIYFAVPLWISGLVIAALWLPTSLISLYYFPAFGAISLALLLVLVTLPLTDKPPLLVDKFLKYSFKITKDYFPITIDYVNRDAFKDGNGPYVIGYEPHSVLPQAISYFGDYGAFMDFVAPCLARSRLLVSSTGFWAPIMRHLWWWLGCRPVDRKSFRGILKEGRNAALCPGGVQECLHMGAGKEVMYLRKRHGFVKLAIEAGAPLVPTFAFGQTEVYRYVRPFIDVPLFFVPRHRAFSIARRIGYVPMLITGWLGTAMPHRIPIRVVVGEPIPVPKVDSPPPELVQEYLDKFIDAMVALFENNKGRYGYKHLRMEVY